jgi:hypothetical protein
MKRSTGLRNYMLSTGSLKTALDGKVINIYAGAVPATADAALSPDNVLLATISVSGSGTGLTMAAAAAAGQLTKNSSEVWSGETLANGTAAFFRMQTAADDNAASTTAVRLQGTVALDGADMNFATLSLVAGNTRQINYFVISVSAG